jgi:aryl-alcohol dehydrogenase-like predicted oxidoreductase
MTFGLQCDEATSGAILDRAAEGGIDFLDTSDAYPLGGDLATSRTHERALSIARSAARAARSYRRVAR